MLTEIAIGCLLVMLTTVVHGACTVVAMESLRRTHHSLHLSDPGLIQRTTQVGGLVLGMFLVSLLDAALWAYTFLTVGAIEELEQALYFSMVTFTTLGYGDVTLSSDWRLLASFEAANGIIIFGWTTALVVAYIQRLTPHAKQG